MEKESITAKKSFDFSIEIVKLCKLLRNQKEFVLADQLLRSGTSIGANIEEARGAQSRKDFIAKMSIATKEARETRYWILLIKEINILGLDFTSYLNQVDEIIRLLIASIKTASKNIDKRSKSFVIFSLKNYFLSLAKRTDCHREAVIKRKIIYQEELISR